MTHHTPPEARCVVDRGLTRKYQVQRHDGRDGSGQKHEGCEYFVLDLTHDKNARVAASAYADAIKETNFELYRDLSCRLFVLSGWCSEEEAKAWAAGR